MGELRAFGDWRGCLFCVCAWFGVNWCFVLLNCACCVYHKGSGSHVQLCPRPCSSPSISQAFHPPTQTTQRCEVRALMPKCSPVATACVSSPKDWAVLIGSHMQQEVVISFGASTSRRTCPHMDCASTEMQNTYCNNFTSGNHVRGASLQRIFRALLGDLSAPMHD